jgi:hypothetical protein
MFFIAAILFHDMLLNEEEHDYYRDESSEWEGSELINFEKFRRLRVSIHYYLLHATRLAA